VTKCVMINSQIFKHDCCLSKDYMVLRNLRENMMYSNYVSFYHYIVYAKYSP